MNASRPSSKTVRRGFFQRYSAAILLLFVLAAPLLVYGAARAIDTNSNRVADWLPSHLEETVALADFNRWFGDGHFVVVSWDGCRIDLTRPATDTSGDDPRLGQLAAMLDPATAAVGEPAADSLSTGPPMPAAVGVSDAERQTFFKGVMTSRMLLQTLTEPPLNIPHDEAVRRLTGNILGPQGQACAVVFLTDASTDQLRQAIGVRQSRWIDRHLPQGALFRALQACDLSLDQAHLGGPPVDNLAINEEGQRTLLRLGLAAGALGLFLAWWSLRSVMLTLIVFLCGIISTFGATAAIWTFGSHADAIVLAMPSLIYVLTISGAIHLINYYRQEVQTGTIAGAAGRALAMGYKPAALCSVTTALGLLSLAASDLAPIRRFGAFSALGMILMLAVLFLLLPAALDVFGRRRAFGLCNGQPPRRSSSRKAAAAQQAKLSMRWSSRWARWVIRYRRSVAVTSVLLMIALGFGIQRIRTSVDLLKLFDNDTRILADYHWLEANLGNLVPLEVLVRFDAQVAGDVTSADTTQNTDIADAATAGKLAPRPTTAQPTPLAMLKRIEIVDQVRREIEQQFGSSGQQLIAPPMSAIAFLPPLPGDQRGTAAVIRQRIMNRKFQQSRAALESSGYLMTDPTSGDELWRISLRVAAFKGVDYGQLAQQVRSAVSPIVDQASARLPSVDGQPAIEAIHTGAIPIVYKAQRELLESLIHSTVWSFLTITPLLMWVTRGIAAGLVAMLPNLLPVISVFGSMGWMDIPVDIGCMMTASIALGVAVDDTIHFLFWYRHHQAGAANRNAAIESACQSCCVPTLQAALINGLGLSVFLLSTFTPTKQFGLLMLVILTCGAAAELILLPAILASPLGRVFDLPQPRPAIQQVIIQHPAAIEQPARQRRRSKVRLAR